MPAFRNVKHRSSGRIWKQIPIIYDEQGWETFPDSALNASSNNDVSSPHSSRTSPTPSLADADFVALPAAPKSKSSRRGDADHVPRPRNAFIIYRSHVCQISSGHDQNQISIKAGKAWNALNKEEKQPFVLLAEKEKRDHQAKFPNYTYTPGSKSNATRRKIPRRMKTSAPLKKPFAPRVKREHRSPSVALSTSRESTPPARPEIAAPSVVKVESSPPATPESMLDLTMPPSEPVFSTSLEFVPTSDIPLLELSPSTKPDQDDKLALSLRPRTYHIIDAPFGLRSNIGPRMMGSFLPWASSPLESDIDDLDVAGCASHPSSPQSFSTISSSSQLPFPPGLANEPYDPLSTYDAQERGFLTPVDVDMTTPLDDAEYSYMTAYFDFDAADQALNKMTSMP